MKQIRKFYNKILLFIKRRQIIFVSFALIISIIYYLFDKDDPLVLKSVLPAVAAAALKAAATGAVQGGIQGAQNAEEGQSKTAAALGGAAKGAVSNAASAGLSTAANAAKSAATTKKALDAKKAADAGNAAQKMDIPQKPKNMPSNPKMDNGGADKLNAKPEGMDSGTTKEAQKASGASDVDKEKASSKKDRMLPSVESKDEEGESDLNEASDELIEKPKKSKPLKYIISVVVIFVFILPIFFVQSEMYTGKTISGFDCDSDTPSAACETGNGIQDFFEKAKNLLRGYFVTDDKLLATKAQALYDKFYKDYKIKIDIPLLLSTVLADGLKYSDDLDDAERRIFNKELVNRFNYLEEAANLQYDIYETQYECILIDGVPSMKPLTKVKFESGEKKDQLPCGTTNVGEIVYRYDFQIDLTEYYEKLRENPETLAKIYGEDFVDTDGDLDLLIQKIKMQKDVFDIVYGSKQDDVCASPGNVPAELLYDLKINLQTPIKGTYYISSYFGIREGQYQNHTGIDVYGDTTIYAAGDGVVTRANTETLGGNVIEITHTSTDGRKFVSQYGHLKTMLVSVGDTVVGGETIIGVMGSTGLATTGVHLHFQFWEKLSDGQTQIYNPLTLFVGADNYSYQCVGSKVTSDTCTSTGGSIAYISDKNDYDYNLIRAIFRVKGIKEISEVKNEIEFGPDFESYIKDRIFNGTTEQRLMLSDIDIANKKIRVDGTWFSYDGNEVSHYVLKTNFIKKYGSVDEWVYEHLNMGVGSILGSNFVCLGYSSAEAMYLEWNESHHNQVLDTIKYIGTCLGLVNELKNDKNMTEDQLKERALKIANVYFENTNEYEKNSPAKSIVSTYLELKETGESLKVLLYDCTSINNLDSIIGEKGEQCDMYREKGKCLANISKYDNDQYWGRFVKQAGTSLSRIRLLAAAHELWGYVRYCNDPSETYTSTGERCRLTGWFDSREFDPAWSTLVGPDTGDVLGGLDCGGFITRAYTTFIRRYYFKDRYSAFDNYKPNYVLHDDGMCQTDTKYTTHYEFGEGNFQSYFSTHTLKPGDVLCDTAGDTRHVIMFIGWDDDNGNGKWESSEMMYFIHTGDPEKGVEVYARAFSNIDNVAKDLVYTSYFTLNDKVK